MGDDLQKGTTYATGGVGGQGTITSSNLNAHVDDAIIKPTFITTKAARTPGALTDQVLLESGGTLYRMGLQTMYDLLVQSGSVIQTVVAAPYTANANLGVIPGDDTFPQISEGTQILTLSITPRLATSQIRLTFNGFGTVDLAAGLMAALFRGNQANALKTTMVVVSTPNYKMELNIDWVDTPGAVTAQIYSIRVGSANGIARMNGSTTGRLFGGSAACTLVAQEIKL